MKITLIKAIKQDGSCKYVPADKQSAAKIDQLRNEYASNDDIDRIKYLLNLHGDELVILK